MLSSVNNFAYLSIPFENYASVYEVTLLIFLSSFDP